jgi:hypothetical protein
MNSSGMLVGAGPSNRGVRRKSVPSVEARTHARVRSTHSTPWPTLTEPLTPQYSQSPSDPQYPCLLCTHRTLCSFVLTVPLTPQ